MIEFQPSALSGSTLSLNPTSTLFNLYDNAGSGFYLQGGQSDTETLDGWLTTFPHLSSEGLDRIWIAEGLTGTNTGADSLTVNSLNVTTATASVPEPLSLSIFGAGLVAAAAMRRRKKVKQV